METNAQPRGTASLELIGMKFDDQPMILRRPADLFGGFQRKEMGLHEAIAKIPAQSQQIYVDALTQLIENLANTNNTQPNKTKLEDRSE